MQRRNMLFIACVFILILTSCVNNSPTGIAPFVYVREKDQGGYEVVEYYMTNPVTEYINKELNGVHYLNSYYDENRYYFGLSHAFFVYERETKRIIELGRMSVNAVKKINDEIWVALDIGLQRDGYVSSLCKINEQTEIDCLYDVKNQQIHDFYIDFENQVFYSAGPGVNKKSKDMDQEYKVLQYNMQTGEEVTIKYNEHEIEADRLTHICPGQFITGDGDIYQETGEKIGEVIGTKGKKLNTQINDLSMNETTFLDYDNKLLEVYGCEDSKLNHRRTIILEYEPNIYPDYYSWETTDEGEITMPIDSGDNIFEYIGFQSVNTRSGEVQVYLFDESVYNLHSIARFQ